MTYRAALDSAALLVTAAGLVVGAVVLVRTGRPLEAIKTLLDMLTAAGAIRLAADPEWQRLTTTALIVLIRRIVGFGLSRYRGVRLPRPGRPAAPG